MEGLIENIGIILTNIINWFQEVGGSLITNPIFIIVLAVTFVFLLINLLTSLINEKQAKQLAIELTSSTDELEYYRSLSPEEKEEYNRTHI